MNIQECIAATIAQHDCWDYAGDLECRCGEFYGDNKLWADHVAAVLMSELGLAQQWLTRHESGGARIFDIEQEAREHFRGFVYRAPGVEDPGSGHLTGIESRFVTGWRDE